MKKPEMKVVGETTGVGSTRPDKTEKTGLYIRVNDDAAIKIRRAAGARAWPTGRYIEALYALHASMRVLAKTNPEVKKELEALDLQTISE